jgi:hypothetical protein
MRPVVADVSAPRTGGVNLFHHDGIDGLKLHKNFVNRLNDRLSTSSSQTTRVIQAFQVFATSEAALPVNPPPSATDSTLESLVATLKQDVATAEIRRELFTSRLSPSQQTSIKLSPLAPIALVPFSDAQIDQMAATLAKLPPVVRPDGTLAQANPTPTVNVAVNAIVNAIAEASVHPLLFLKPENFYLNPNVMFTLSFSGTPASSAPGFFIRGPHGAFLPGATLHPHAPN